MQAGHPSGYIHVEHVQVDIIATPGQGFAVGGEDHTGDVVHRASGAMVAGNPFGGGQRDVPGPDRDVDLGMVELAGSLREVGGDTDGCLAESGNRE